MKVPVRIPAAPARSRPLLKNRKIISGQRLVDRGSVLVTGGAGFIGFHLCRQLLEDGYTVHAVDNLITGQKKHVSVLQKYPRFQFRNLDVVHPTFPKIFSRLPVEAIFHLACPTGVPNIETLALEMLETCSIGTMHVLQIARMHGAKVLFTSTSEIYGHPQVTPQGEDYFGYVDPIGPRSPYEEGKRFAETVFVAYARKFQLDIKIARLFNVYGPGMSNDDHRVVPQFLRSIETGGEIRIYGDGLQKRTLVYIDDLVDGLRLIYTKGKPGEVYNIGGHRPITIHALAKQLLRVSKRKNGISYHPHFIEDHRHRNPRLTKIRKLGWIPRVSLYEGLRRTLASRQNGNMV